MSDRRCTRLIRLSGHYNNKKSGCRILRMRQPFFCLFSSLFVKVFRIHFDLFAIQMPDLIHILLDGAV